MVWHAFMLNPRDFFEDCIRYGKMDFWATGMPWQAINACINNETFEFTPSGAARQLFESTTGLAWDCLDGSAVMESKCPKCDNEVQLPWTTCNRKDSWVGSKAGEDGAGYADSSFRYYCISCQCRIDYDLLKTQKFRKDLLLLLMHNVPMPGTVLSLNGKVESSRFKPAQNS